MGASPESFRIQVWIEIAELESPDPVDPSLAGSPINHTRISEGQPQALSSQVGNKLPWVKATVEKVRRFQSEL